MRNLNDMNDLYNFQDVCLLCEIIENRFEVMHKMHGYNPRRCNSASNKTLQVFEKALTEGSGWLC